MAMKFGEIKGKTVITLDGQSIGTIDELEFDISQWNVTGIQVKLARDKLEGFGLKKPMLGTLRRRVPISRVNEASDHIVLNLRAEQFLACSEGAGDAKGE